MPRLKFLGLLAIVCLCACSHITNRRGQIYSNAVLGRDTVINTRPGSDKSSQTTVSARKILASLRQHGVQVVSAGDNITIILPTDSFFSHDSPNLRIEWDPRLNNVARFIRMMPTVSIYIKAYTDKTNQQQRAKALTLQQAHAIADYLWQRQIDTRLLYSDGFGDKQPIASNQTVRGRALNRRIEIHLRQHHACCVL